MAKSIMQDGKYCYICRKEYNINTVSGLEEHHVFGGPLRPLSEHYGLKVYLCHRHHNEPPLGVHFNATARWRLERDAKRAFDLRHGAWMLDKLIKRVQEEAPHAV
ncbi:MAG TPA: hypothetical protein H9810_06380 [Candidatus Gemmiger excrementavium]|uniref:Uncharacterized protein n=1 Tax=Candidatus Gemmiger excrementavium TaxID=2838608 RepID=A0A9D2JGG8_9FIRM|nr:hypothetical protein [Candidatus Gemmiger excrementavium]